MIHGNDDEIVPKKMMQATRVILEDNNFVVDSYLIQNLGHGINNEGIEIGEKFLVKHLLKC